MGPKSNMRVVGYLRNGCATNTGGHILSCRLLTMICKCFQSASLALVSLPKCLPSEKKKKTSRNSQKRKDLSQVNIIFYFKPDLTY